VRDSVDAVLRVAHLLPNHALPVVHGALVKLHVSVTQGAELALVAFELLQRRDDQTILKGYLFGNNDTENCILQSVRCVRAQIVLLCPSNKYRNPNPHT
jgi:hypothetical protein